FIVVSSEPCAASFDAYCPRRASHAPAAPTTRPMRIPAMTIGPTNAREAVGRHVPDHENARSNEPVSPSDLARRAYPGPSETIKPEKAALCGNALLRERLRDR